MKQLSDAVQIGRFTTKNRFAIPPMVCFHWSDDSGTVVQKNLDHYRELAAGGAGFIIAEATAVNRPGRLHNTELGLWEDGQIEGWRQIAEEVHRYDVPFVVQLLHAGVTGYFQPSLGPSDYYAKPDDRRVFDGKAMTEEQVEDARDDFIRAALRAQEAGLDGVELHGCHGYLICQFLNRNLNHRTDRYGVEETFALEVLRGIREACGPDFLVGIRLAAFEPTLEDGLRHAKALANDVDFLDISYGFNGQSTPEKPEDFPASAAFYGAKVIKQALPNVPVFGVDGITSGEDARIALEASGVDLVDVGRGVLVNPDFPRDALAGRDTGRCLHCKNGCRWSPLSGGRETDCPGKKLYLRNR